MSSGAQSEVITSCRPASRSALNVWKNSSRVRARPARNWTSSMRTTSALRKRCLKSAVLFTRTASTNSLVNSSMVA